MALGGGSGFSFRTALISRHYVSGAFVFRVLKVVQSAYWCDSITAPVDSNSMCQPDGFQDSKANVPS